MARYRKIETRIWNDSKFSRLSDRGKLCFLFLLTHPHLTSLGAMRATLPGLASELGWTDKAFTEAFRETSAMGLVENDETSCFVWVPKFLKYNGPESPNVVKSWGSSLDLLPECEMKDRLIDTTAGFISTLPEAFQKAFESLSEVFRKSMPNQEPEQEPKPNPTLRPYRKPSDPELENRFEAFWKSYPKKSNKGQAIKAWMSLKPDSELCEKIHAAIEIQKKSRKWLKNEGEFIPNPATWINGLCWEDEPEKTPKVEPDDWSSLEAKQKQQQSKPNPTAESVMQ